MGMNWFHHRKPNHLSQATFAMLLQFVHIPLALCILDVTEYNNFIIVDAEASKPEHQ
jgi:hypothetical protein